jgi:hypothetical protein
MPLRPNYTLRQFYLILLKKLLRFFNAYSNRELQMQYVLQMNVLRRNDVAMEN